MSDNIAPLPPNASVWVRKPRIFVLDDQRLLADTLANILSLNGYDAVPLYTAGAALELAEKTPPDLLITDIMLSPDSINGMDLAMYFQREYRNCEIVLISGHAASIEMHGRARRRGHDFPLLHKPVHPEEVLKIVDDRLAKRHGEEELRKAS